MWPTVVVFPAHHTPARSTTTTTHLPTTTGYLFREELFYLLTKETKFRNVVRTLLSASLECFYYQ